MNRVRGEFLHGARWLGISAAGNFILSLAAAVLLARLLTPEDFGAFFAALIPVLLASSLCDAGLGTGIVQRKELSSQHVAAAFWAVIVVGLALGLSLFLAAPAIARALGEPRTIDLIVWLAPSIPLASAGRIPFALLQREVRFRPRAAILLTSHIIHTIAAAGFALSGLGVFSLVYAHLIRQALETAAAWRISGMRPSARVSLPALGDLIPFSMPVLGTALVQFVTSNADLYLIARGLGSGALGFYNRAQHLVSTLGLQLGTVIFPSGLAALSRIQDDPTAVGRTYLRICGATALLLLPAIAGIYATAPALVVALYGENWMEIIPLLRILAPAGALLALQAPIWPVLLALGRSKSVLFWNVVRAGTLAGCVAAALPWGLPAACGGVVASLAVSNVVGHVLALRATGARAWDLAAGLWAPIIGSAAILALEMAIRSRFSATASPGTYLAIVVPAGISVYAAAMALLNRRQLVDVLVATAEAAGLRSTSTPAER